MCLWNGLVWSNVEKCRMTIAESPFVPREKLFEKQKYFQSIQKHTYLKGRYDRITSVAIPGALAASCLFMIVSTSPTLVFVLCSLFWCHGLGSCYVLFLHNCISFLFLLTKMNVEGSVKVHSIVKWVFWPLRLSVVISVLLL